MASAEKRVRNGRARWCARYRTPDGHQRTRTFARKVDADHFLVEIEASKQRVRRSAAGESHGRRLG